MATKKSGATEKEQQNKEQASDELRVRIHKLSEDSGKKLKAHASVNLPGGFVIHGIKVYENEKKGLFICMPQSSYKNSFGETKYEDIFHPVTAEARNKLIDAVTDAYIQSLEQEQDSSQSEEKTTPDKGISMAR